ncbi:MAG: radical SAM protein, partial [Clostridia bacterium]|nr:radical SAM protein [Clostridia bacterium]
MNIERCEICPNMCGIDRNERAGLCGEQAGARVARIAAHYWEEPVISGAKGSGTIFFTGCSMSCVFCQNFEISHNGRGKEYNVDMLIESIKELERQGVHNINFVNPTHFAHIIKLVLTKYKPAVPIVYNSGGYDRAETLRELDGLIDIYLPDFKYYDNAIALKYSGRNNYYEYATSAIREMVRQRGAPEIQDGIM